MKENTILWTMMMLLVSRSNMILIRDPYLFHRNSSILLDAHLIILEEHDKAKHREVEGKE